MTSWRRHVRMSCPAALFDSLISSGAHEANKLSSSTRVGSGAHVNDAAPFSYDRAMCRNCARAEWLKIGSDQRLGCRSVNFLRRLTYWQATGALMVNQPSPSEAQAHMD